MESFSLSLVVLRKLSRFLNVKLFFFLFSYQLKCFTRILQHETESASFNLKNQENHQAVLNSGRPDHLAQY